jgi:hypothetical protein
MSSSTQIHRPGEEVVATEDGVVSSGHNHGASIYMALRGPPTATEQGAVSTRAALARAVSLGLCPCKHGRHQGASVSTSMNKGSVGGG